MSISQKTVGVLGGGQLGRMMMDPAHRLGISLLVLDQGLSPAKQLSASPHHVDGDFKDPQKIVELAKKCDVLTVEIEHVDVKSLKQLGNVEIEPTPETIEIIQDKYLQKVHLGKHKVPTAEFCEVEASKDAIVKVAKEFGYPMMLKAKKLAYDGKGNAVVKSEADIDQAISSLTTGQSQDKPLYVEKWANFTKELAVMVARSTTGEVVSYPCTETIQRDSICHIVFCPAPIDGLLASNACKVAEDAIKCFNGAGIYGVEMFLMNDGQILINEIAPRPHNSGHYTIEACNTSQFEQHLRAILGLPLGDTSLKVPAAAMLNILGTGSGPEALQDTLKACQTAMTIPGATVHLYGKAEARKGRKMGHITVVGNSLTEVMDRIQLLEQDIPGIDKSTARKWNPSPLVSIIMGSDSDLPTMKPCATILKEFDVPFEISIVSAHRTPERMVQFAKQAHERGVKIIVAAAGGAAHLPGMVAAITPLPVIGVPVALKYLDGMDSLYSIVQMPRGVPVATVAINNATNAALLAIRMLGSFVPSYLNKMIDYQKRMEKEVMGKVDKMETQGWEAYQ